MSSYTCDTCSKVYKTEKNLAKHTCNPSPVTFRCDTCSKVYKTEKNLAKHTCNPSPVTFRCDTCSKVYKTEKNLAKHKSNCGQVENPRQQPDDPGHSCPGCFKVLKSKGALTRHLSKCTAVTITFDCPRCPKKYATAENLNQHNKFCKPPLDNGFSCVCGRVCRSIRGLNHHQLKCPSVDFNKNKYEMAKSNALTDFFNDQPTQGEWYYEQQLGLCLFMAHNVNNVTSKWAMFDLDDTLIKTKSGKVFGISASDWTWVNEDHPKKLQRLVNKGYTIVIISNQAGCKKDQSKIKEKLNQIQTTLEGVPLVAAFATDYNLYRKPNIKVIPYLESFLSTKMDPEGSFYIGDAAGRPKDHSCCDRKFAANLEVTFRPIEQFIDPKYEDDDYTWGFDPKEYLTTTTDKVPMVPEDQPQELVLMCGYPGSGKSTFAKTNLFSYTYVSKDDLKGKSLSALIKKALSEGKSVVVDNTNIDPETRAFYINIAKDHTVPCRCYFMDVPLDLCKHLNHVRNVQSDNNVKVVPMVAYNIMKSKFVKPTTKESFTEVVDVPFVPTFNSKDDEEAFSKWTI